MCEEFIARGYHYLFIAISVALLLHFLRSRYSEVELLRIHKNIIYLPDAIEICAYMVSGAMLFINAVIPQNDLSITILAFSIFFAFNSGFSKYANFIKSQIYEKKKSRILEEEISKLNKRINEIESTIRHS